MNSLYAKKSYPLNETEKLIFDYMTKNELVFFGRAWSWVDTFTSVHGRSTWSSAGLTNRPFYGRREIECYDDLAKVIEEQFSTLEDSSMTLKDYVEDSIEYYKEKYPKYLFQAHSIYNCIKTGDFTDWNKSPYNTMAVQRVVYEDTPLDRAMRNYFEVPYKEALEKKLLEFLDSKGLEIITADSDKFLSQNGNVSYYQMMPRSIPHFINTWINKGDRLMLESPKNNLQLWYEDQIDQYGDLPSFCVKKSMKESITRTKNLKENPKLKTRIKKIEKYNEGNNMRNTRLQEKSFKIKVMGNVQKDANLEIALDNTGVEYASYGKYVIVKSKNDNQMKAVMNELEDMGYNTEDICTPYYESTTKNLTVDSEKKAMKIKENKKIHSRGKNMKESALKTKYQKLKEADDGWIKVDETFQELMDKYMDSESPCSTLIGEIVAAANKLIYRYYNDGDIPGIGYGNETCNQPLEYLMANGVLQTKFNNSCKLIEYIVDNEDCYEQEIIRCLQDWVIDWWNDNMDICEEPVEDGGWLEADIGELSVCDDCGYREWDAFFHQWSGDTQLCDDCYKAREEEEDYDDDFFEDDED